MQPYDLLPLKGLSGLARESILEEFGGRCPTLLEISSIPDSSLLRLPGFGPTTLSKIRKFLIYNDDKSSQNSKYSHDDLSDEFGRVLFEAIQMHDTFNRRQKELLSKIQELLNETRKRRSSQDAAIDLAAHTAFRNDT